MSKLKSDIGTTGIPAQDGNDVGTHVTVLGRFFFLPFPRILGQQVQVYPGLFMAIILMTRLATWGLRE